MNIMIDGVEGVKSASPEDIGNDALPYNQEIGSFKENTPKQVLRTTS